MLNTDIAALVEALPGLSARDAGFAQSLISQAAERGLSDKQMFWVKKLAAPKAPAPVAIAIDLSPINTLFANVAGKKRPSLLFATADGTQYRLSVAGPKSQQPGSINVNDTVRGYDASTWFGRITLSGAFEPSRRNEAETTTAVAAALEAFASDPAGQSAAFGHETGTCCFCGHELDNDHSKALGYGPICARRWGMPHSYTRPVAGRVIPPPPTHRKDQP